MRYYKSNSLALSYREYWRLAPGLFPLLYAWGAKALRKPLRLAVGVPSPRPTRDTLAKAEEIPEEAKGPLDLIAKELTGSGMRLLHYGMARDSLILPPAAVCYAEFSDSSGLLWARVFVALQPVPLKPRVKAFVVAFSRLADDRFLCTSNKAQEMDSSSLVIARYFEGISAVETIQRHRKDLERMQVKPGVLRYQTEAQREQWADEYEFRTFEEAVRKGKYVEMTEEEVARAREALLSAGAAGGDGQPTPNSEATREIIQLMEQDLHAKQSGGNAILLLVVSMLAFVAASRLNWSGREVGILVAIIFFHEMGHFIAMRVFGYKNVRMFFIPFLGAAVTGQAIQRSGWKKAIVSLMGPGPGIVVGLGLAFAGVVIDSPLLALSAWMLIFLNAFNLLPILPLDGGWTLQALLFGRHPTIETVFRLLASLALIWYAFASSAVVLGLLGGSMLLTIAFGHKVAKIAKEIRREGEEGTLEGDFSPSLVGRIIPKVRATMGTVDSKTLATVTRSVYEKAVERPPGIVATIVLLGAYVGLIAFGFVGAAVLVANRNAALDFSSSEEQSLNFEVSDLNFAEADDGRLLNCNLADPVGTKLQLALELPAQGTNLFVFSRGEFRASERADGQIFLALLAEKLNAANWTASTDKTNRLAFTAAIMGTNLQHGVTKDSQIAGLFNSEMPGDWIVTKTFFGDGELEAYLAINPVEREAMIYRKDDESGPEIVREFSRLFEFGAKPEPK